MAFYFVIKPHWSFPQVLCVYSEPDISSSSTQLHCCTKTSKNTLMKWQLTCSFITTNTHTVVYFDKIPHTLSCCQYALENQMCINMLLKIVLNKSLLLLQVWQKPQRPLFLGKTFLKWMICSWPGFIDKGLQQDPMGWEPRKPKNIITGCSKTYLLDQHFFSFRKSSSAGLEQLDILGNIVFGPGVNIHPEWQPLIGSNFSTNRYLHC